MLSLKSKNVVKFVQISANKFMAGHIYSNWIPVESIIIPVALSEPATIAGASVDETFNLIVNVSSPS